MPGKYPFVKKSDVSHEKKLGKFCNLSVYIEIPIQI